MPYRSTSFWESCGSSQWLKWGAEGRGNRARARHLHFASNWWSVWKVSLRVRLTDFARTSYPHCVLITSSCKTSHSCGINGGQWKHFNFKEVCWHSEEFQCGWSEEIRVDSSFYKIPPNKLVNRICTLFTLNRCSCLKSVLLFHLSSDFIWAFLKWTNSLF